MSSAYLNLPKSRSEAVEAGETHYFTGIPCANGHVSPRRVLGCKCLECARETSRIWHAKNSELINSKKKIIRSQNVDRERARNKKWREEKGREYYRQYYHEHRSNDPKYRVDSAISRGISKSIIVGSKAGRKWESLVGYSVNELMAHLERLFLPGMSFENYGCWQIDHKIPKSVFNYETPDDVDFAHCWALDNLRPMWAEENRIKSDRLDQPFQPSLMLRAANDNTPTIGATITAD
ncbi:hypothetical protein K7A42_03260 [Agrobacterium sp. InxBP2]|uniref:hypothetical protein n=1 Tax=Agrobacterium sp. InxBP2 TaxID=2870329 RepID=UPI00249E9152|nr:hypothetical protein [Agrobacterium sp. InxBP2]MCW8279891.1 hypothetical protein [Agrobacterium sp. InxBP2]